MKPPKRDKNQIAISLLETFFIIVAIVDNIELNRWTEDQGTLKCKI